MCVSHLGKFVLKYDTFVVHHTVGDEAGFCPLPVLDGMSSIRVFGWNPSPLNIFLDCNLLGTFIACNFILLHTLKLTEVPHLRVVQLLCCKESSRSLFVTDE